MRQQEYNEVQDIKRDLAFFVVILIGIMGLMVVSADASEECISWKWIQTGSHTECSGWYCWNVPEYSLVCTEYAPDPVIIVTETPEPTPTYQQPTTIGFAYTFGHNDTERYQIEKNIGDMRAIYMMENIAWSNGLYPSEFEKKYNIR